MKLLRLLPLLASLLLIALYAHAQTYVNGQAAGSLSTATPYPVGTNTPVPLLTNNNSRMCGWTMNWTEAGNLKCQPVAGSTTAAGVAPSSTNGFTMSSAKTPWTSSQLTDDPRVGWSCVSDSGTLNVSVEEVYHCANSKIGM